MVGRASTSLVGRDTSLAALRETLQRAARGSPSLVLLSGETGVGKTRLVRELVERERPSLLYGACVPMAGEPLPFAPLLQGLRRLGDSPALRRQLTRSPDLARLLPGWAVDSQVPEQHPTASSRLALFQGVLELLARLGVQEPTVHVVEDLHWADRSTLDLLRYLAVNLTSERVVLLATYRDDEVLVGSPLAGWLAEVARLPMSRRMTLDRLGREDATRLISELLGSAPDVALRESTLSRSAGNPLFVEHLVREGRAADELPLTLRELLLARVAALPARTQELLRAVAVLGRPSPVPLVAGVLGAPGTDTESWIRPAVRQHVLDVRTDDLVGFTHPAFTEVVYAALLPVERAALHRRAAEALEVLEAGTRADSSTGELARHWLAAGDLQRALTASVVAGTAAGEMYAFADAQSSFVRAAQLAQEVPSGLDRGWLLTQAAQAASLAGDSDEAVRLAESALAVTAAPEAQASLLERLGAYHFLAGRGPEAQRCLQEALGLVPAEPPTVLLARVYAGLALCAVAWSRLDEAEGWCSRGLAAAHGSGARREEGLLRNAAGMVAATRGELDEGISLAREALAIAREVGTPDDLSLAYVNLAHVLGLAGRLDDVAALGREGSEVLTRVGLAHQVGALLSANAAEALINAGRLPEAAELLEGALSPEPRGIMAAPVLLQAGRLATVRGDLPLARERCRRARTVLEAEHAPAAWLRSVIEAAVEVELWAGRPDAAHDLVVEGLELVEGTDEQSFGGLLVTLGLRALADQAETQRGTASVERITRQRSVLERAASLTASIGLPDDAAVDAWRVAEVARLDRASDPALWAGVVERWQALGMVLLATYAGWREAEARLDAHADATGIAALRESHRHAVGIGATLQAEETRRLALWHRIDLPDQPEPVGPGLVDAPAAAAAAYALTDRELEVLSGLAAGRTNREIADTLYISVKTASVHVSNILRKLDVSGRQEAARIAFRLGIGA